MATPMGSLIRSATRRPGEPLNILTFPTHEPYEVALCKTGHRFWAYRHPAVRDWNHECRRVPENYVLLNGARGDAQVPPDVDFDLVLSNNRFGQYQLGVELATKLHLPHVCMEHTLPHPGWAVEHLAQLRTYKADLNLFISDYNREQWGWAENEARVVHHGIDTVTFSPDDSVERKPVVLTCVNDFVNRDWCCGYGIWARVTEGLPTRVRGNTPGLSEGTKTVEELVGELRSAAIYFNTSTYSPVPTALLEAMAAGCAVVTTATCMIPEIIRHNVNGLITNNEKHLREYLEHLLANPGECRRLGDAARETVLREFSPDQFVANWNSAFDSVTR